MIPWPSPSGGALTPLSGMLHPRRRDRYCPLVRGGARRVKRATGPNRRHPACEPSGGRNQVAPASPADDSPSLSSSAPNLGSRAERIEAGQPREVEVGRHALRRLARRPRRPHRSPRARRAATPRRRRRASPAAVRAAPRGSSGPRPSGPRSRAPTPAYRGSGPRGAIPRRRARAVAMPSSTRPRATLAMPALSRAVASSFSKESASSR